jgi:uncharacterized OB-fold protein
MTLFRCTCCGKSYVTAPVVCRCGGEEFEAQPASGKGEVYSCTTLYAAAERFEKDVPFEIAIIELEGGARLTARIEGRRVDVGDPVNLVEQRAGVYFFSAA